MQQEKQPTVIVPMKDLSPQALDGIVENFILREGTDYGNQEVSFEKKKEQIIKQIEKNKVLILFETESSSIHLMNKTDWDKANQT